MKLIIVCLVLAGLVSACGGSGHVAAPTASEPTAVVWISAPPASLAVNARATVSAAATFPFGMTGGNAAVTWTVTCGGGACGAFSASDNAGAVTYTAPPAVPGARLVTVTATSVANPSLAISAAITIVAPIPITVSFAQTPPASVQVGAAVDLVATITNDVAENPEVAWSVTCAAAACGDFDSATTASGAATAFTAPAAIPSGGSVKITATSVTDRTKSASVTIVVTAAAPTLANGTYVFQLDGPPGNQASFVTGVLVAEDGRITGGEQDSIAYSTDADGNSYGNPLYEAITGGTYQTTADGNLQISIMLGPDELETLNGTLSAANHGFVAGLNGASLSGTLELQSSTAAPAGGYAISLFGGDESQAPTWIGGVLNVDGPGSISGAGSRLDVIDAGGQASGSFLLGPGSVSAPDSQGRVQISLQPSGTTLPPIPLVGYVVDGTRIRLIESGNSNDASNYQGVLGGLALGQGVTTGKYAAAALTGASFVFGAQGSDAQGTLQMAGVFSLEAGGAVTGTLNWNDLTGNAAQAPQGFTGTYTLDPSGRLTLSQLTNGSDFSYSMYFYLAADGNALLLSNDADDTFTGQGFQRQVAPFTAASIDGTYGLNLTRFAPNPDSSGLQESTAIGTLTAVAGSTGATASGFADAGDGGPDVAISGSISSEETGIFGAGFTGLDPDSPDTPGKFTLYVVDGTRSVLIETDGSALTLGTLEGGG
jgi:hypothetical protein